MLGSSEMLLNQLSAAWQSIAGLQPANGGHRDLFLIAIFPIRQVDGTSHRPSGGVRRSRFDHHSLGRDWPDIQFQRHMAIGYKHRHDDRHVPDGISDSEYSESR